MRLRLLAALVLIGATGVPAAAQEPSITLRASAGTLTVGEMVTLSGRLTGTDECVSGRTILVERTVHSSGVVNGVTLGVSDAGGSFSGELPVQVSADYVAVPRTAGDCPTDLSNVVTVLARVRVAARATADRVRRGDTTSIVGEIQPAHPGTRVTLQRRDDGAWRDVRTAALDDGARFRFPVRVTWSRSRTFRVMWGPGDDDHESGHSPRIRILSVTAARVVRR